MSFPMIYVSLRPSLDTDKPLYVTDYKWSDIHI